ncbi:MAG: hypothetical protein COU28_02340 [Candidatus Magasanikbacteria bacterium CG10_big_fil_rev_8_21_14_0_10_36_16]|uniref:Uncharacterized protein n=1 Tax=Candidatus Magasanikbacteria bacterium CG10_big_fil_rev_8_21_14_0_10_36_16 TaxID=1974645 RepID=A0A2H0TYI1_9BACT|nr:MAG: hypothetical protein COU28_02340 [Candidatus Magasanikbacteria bacterium CG10_big_fil_rev_8_21_14_0_10_36_16]
MNNGFNVPNTEAFKSKLPSLNLVDNKPGSLNDTLGNLDNEEPPHDEDRESPPPDRGFETQPEDLP